MGRNSFGFGGGFGRVDVPHLRRIRQQSVLSQQQLSQSSGVARDTVSKLETGRRKAYPKTIQSLAASLGVEPQELISAPEEVVYGKAPKESEQAPGQNEGKRKAGF